MLTFFLVLATDGAPVIGLLLGALGWGVFPARWLNRTAPLGKLLALALALGLGAVGLTALALGCAGLMTPFTAIALLAAGAVQGFVFLGSLLRAPERAQTRGVVVAPRWGTRDSLLAALALLPLFIPLGVALYAACLPPGLLWYGEGRGYDVLEYHLQVPREWFQAGRIHFLPHNVYGSFPQQVEILYYLLMNMLGDAHAAAIPAQLLHVALGLAFVAACAAWATPGWPRILALLVTGGVPWLAYVGPLAYVENGLLLFTAVAAGMLVDQVRGQVACANKAALAAGLCAGWASGCKYTALALVAAAMGTAWLSVLPGGLMKRARLAIFFAVGVIAAFGPWAWRNQAFTGNPVYPFAYAFFGGDGWSVEQAEQWARGHAPAGAAATVVGRAAAAVRELVGQVDQRGWHPSYFGTAPLLLGLCGWFMGRGRARWFLILHAGLCVAVWVSATHMPGRFAVPLIVPLVFLAGGSLADGPAAMPETARARAASERRSSKWTMGVLVAASLAALGQSFIPLTLMREHEDGYRRQFNAHAGSGSDFSLANLLGRTDLMIDANPLNSLPASSHIWLIGEARVYYVERRVSYTVVFNRDPWLGYAEGRPAHMAVEWLRSRGVTNVVFSWPEIARLRATYGFAPFVTREWAQSLAAHGLVRIAAEHETGGYDIYRMGP